MWKVIAKVRQSGDNILVARCSLLVAGCWLKILNIENCVMINRILTDLKFIQFGPIFAFKSVEIIIATINFLSPYLSKLLNPAIKSIPLKNEI